MTNQAKSIATSLLRAMSYIPYFRSKRRLTSTIQATSQEHQDYLALQLKRSVSKRNSPLQARTKIFVDQIDQVVGFANKEVLCIGARNTEEVQYVRSKCAKSVIGIDLHSNSKSVLVMDMHDMEF